MPAANHSPHSPHRCPDENLCRIQLAAALVEIDRLRALGMDRGSTAFEPIVPDQTFSAPILSPNSLPPTERKSYAVDSLGTIASFDNAHVRGTVDPSVLLNRPVITNLGTLMDALA